MSAVIIYDLLLLPHFREERTHPLTLSLFSLSGDTLHYLLGNRSFIPPFDRTHGEPYLSAIISTGNILFFKQSVNCT